MNAPDVLAVMDDDRRVLVAASRLSSIPTVIADHDEARAAVAEAFAERDRLRNIVRSHEAQILRMTAERAELVEAAKRAEDRLGVLIECDNEDNGGASPDDVAAWETLRAALARCGGAK